MPASGIFFFSFYMLCDILFPEVNHLKQIISIIVLLLLLSGCQHTGPQEQTTVPEKIVTQAPLETTITTHPPSVPVSTEETTASTVPGFDPQALIDSMTLEELVGQIFLARCPEVNAAEDIAKYHLGGYVLFGRDFQKTSPDSIREKLLSFQEAAATPILIAVDEEGGTVTRISSFPQFRDCPFPSPRALYDAGGMELVLSTEAEKCLLLKSLGINVNLAPVCDITTDPSAFMYSRSLGQSAAITGAFAAELCDLMAQQQIGSVLKHFPGYGNNTDTHTGIATDPRSLEVLESNDLIPFRSGIASGCDAILVSHTIVSCLDPSMPASLSPEVIRYLRKKLGFQGVIVTDDLVMEAITELFGPGESAVLAVLAGNDLLCSSEYQVQYAAVLEAAISGRIPREQLESSVARVLHWKYKLGLLIA